MCLFVTLKDKKMKEHRGRLLYNFHANIVNYILDHGIIFGGYVRDTLIHNHNADKFYGGLDEDDPRNIQDVYMDTEYSPETKDRLLLPSDIDCYMTSRDMEKLLCNLKHSPRYVLKKRIDRTCGSENSKYVGNVSGAPLGIMLTHAEIGLAHNPLYESILPYDIRSLTVHLDILHAPALEGKEPPFGDLDFECNCLVMDKSMNIRLSSNLSCMLGIRAYPTSQHKKLCEVIEDTINWRAVLVSKANFERASKMAQKGWRIKENNLSLSVSEEEDVCPICFDSVAEQLRIKPDCCNAKYHPRCFARFVNFQSGVPLSCPTCRNSMSRDVLLDMKIQMWPSNPPPP